MSEKKVKKKFELSGRMKNIAKISSGTMLGQIISFITLPIIARIYGAEIMGIWTLLNSIAIIINSFSDMGLTNALMVEEDDDSMLRLYNVVTTIVFAISIVTGVGVAVYYFIVPNSMELSTAFLAIFMIVLIFALQQTQVCYTWLNRKGKYDVLMKNPMINNSVIGIVAILFGMIGFKKYGYYIAVIFGNIITILHMKRFLPKKMFTLKKEDFKTVFKTRKRFVMYQMPTNVISQVKNQLPVMLIEGFFGTKILGYYSVSVKILNIPITLLANAIGRVFFQTISDMARKGQEIGEFTYRNIVKAMKIAIVPMIFLVAFGDVVIMILFGKEYEMAGAMLQIVSFQNFFTFLMMSSQGITVTLDKQSYAMISCIMQSVGFVIGLGLGAYVFDSVYIGLFLMSVIYVIIQIAYFCALFKVMNMSWKKYIKDALFSIIIILGCAFVLRKAVFALMGLIGINLL